MTITISLIDRRHFIGGSDARIIMGQDEKALLRLWRESVAEACVGRQLGVGKNESQRSRSFTERTRSSAEKGTMALRAGLPHHRCYHTARSAQKTPSQWNAVGTQ